MADLAAQRGTRGSGSSPRPKSAGAYLWFAPTLVLLLVVSLYPVALVVWLSFHRTRFYEVVSWVGLNNYGTVLSSPEFSDVTVNSLTYVAGALAIVLPLGLIAAMALQSIARGAVLFRTLLLLPWTLSMGVVGCIWLWLLNPSYGPISYVIGAIGITPGLMLGDPGIALALIILVTAWWSFPYVMVIMSAALQSIPAELFEAVDIDGGGFVTRLRHVIWPHVNATLGSTALALGILYLTLITLILVMTGGGPLGATSTWSFEVFTSAFRAVDISPSSVISIVVLFANLVLGVLYTRLTGRISG